MDTFKVELEGLFNEKWLIPLLYEYLPKFTYQGEELNINNFERYLKVLQENRHLKYRIEDSENIVSFCVFDTIPIIYHYTDMKTIFYQVFQYDRKINELSLSFLTKCLNSKDGDCSDVKIKSGVDGRSKLSSSILTKLIMFAYQKWLANGKLDIYHL